MTPSSPSQWKILLKQGLVLTIYMAVWFCALIFYDKDALGITGSTYVSYGFALLKALLLSKFMLAAHAISPIKYRSGSSLYSLIALRSTFNAFVVLIFSYLFVGIEGIFKNQGFIEPMLSFCDGNLDRILAVTLMYWLIVLPYVSYRCLGEAMGQENMQSYLSGNNTNKGM